MRIGTGIDLYSNTRGIGGGGGNAGVVLDFMQGAIPAGGQFTRGSGATYTSGPNTLASAATDVPRFENDFTTGAARGLLLEGQVSNPIIRNTNGFTSWMTSAVNVFTNDIIAPDGTMTAPRLVPSNSTTHYHRQTITVTAGTLYVLTFYAMRGSMTDMRYGVYDVSNGADIVAASSYFNQTGAAWMRVTLTFTTPVGCTSIYVNDLLDSGSGGSVYTWGHQLNTLFASSAILTLGAAGVRAGDSLAYTNISATGFNATEGTILIECDFLGSNAGTLQHLVNFNDSVNNGNIILFGASNISAVLDGQTLTSSVAIVPNTTYKIALAYSSGNNEMAINGTLVGDTAFKTKTFSPFSMVDRMIVGNRVDGQRNLFGHIRRITNLPGRRTDADLQTLTT